MLWQFWRAGLQHACICWVFLALQCGSSSWYLATSLWWQVSSVFINCQAHLMQQWSENFTGLSIAQLQFNVSHAWSALM